MQRNTIPYGSPPANPMYSCYSLSPLCVIQSFAPSSSLLLCFSVVGGITLRACLVHTT